MSSSRPGSYTRTAIRLHWLLALGLSATLALGFYMSDLPFSPAKLQYYSWHKWAGITLLLLAVFRLGWRLTHPAPAAPAGMPAWQHAASEWTHRLLYLLMLAIPLSGWLMSSAKGVPTVYFGVLPLPDLLERNVELGKQLGQLHGALNFGLLGLVALHAAAALKHYVIDRDEVLGRMLPFLNKA
ncbi:MULTISPECIES: cytochrome b [Uliginosibacterium]|uniref:Cytochrome b n=1 Tax=Uliginosibacterium aquaticum TaxID=2731212 RepID=A0ABX2IHG7_9RHOO|nr:MULTISPECIES: cytochrome b [Uliginosibacterium]NSL56195.1 cytochrome b [Uliginosibacterium aquaticum]PLK47882.1 cytochrome b [Uliginosibacterium sp. TH139]